MKKGLLLLTALSMTMILGCAQKSSTPIRMAHEQNLNFNDAVSASVSGGVTESGKYTGQDGRSASGIKMIYFATDRYTLDPDQLARLQSDLPKIRNLVSIGKIRVEGNCDEVGTDEYNHALGLKRAKSVKLFLTDNGIPSKMIDIVSYGESNPVCTGGSAACHAKNRRVEINSVQ